ncbi:MAG: response regulator transcription factor [Sphingobacteriia bacterium]|nr:response regulator transcription factor [Sphingobacteriia bacterium]
MAIKILYVEDEIFLGKIVFETLVSRGFDVLMETDGSRVMDAFDSFNPDICVLDIMLPNRNGIEIAEEIRAGNTMMPIIFLTAKTQTEDVVKGFKTGGNDYIRKPFSMEELIVRIENALKIKAGDQTSGAEMAVMIGKFCFDGNKQLLILNGEGRKLSFRETELLRYFCLNINVVIQRKELLNYIWGNDSFFNSRNLDVYITKLRGYLKEDPNLRIITIKGVGYRFVTG